MDALYHARSAATKWGGTPEDYMPLEEWVDESSIHVDDFRHRALRHHSLGIQEAISKFGRMWIISTGKEVPVKKIIERHINEDLGFVPTVGDWVRNLVSKPWMRHKQIKKVEL